MRHARRQGGAVAGGRLCPWRAACFLLVGALLLGGIAAPRGPAGEAAAQGGTEIDWWVIAGAGGTSTGGDVTVSDTVGQAIVGGSAYGSVALSAGFWYGGPGPTWVHLKSFEAVPLSAAILVTWETSQEIDNLGFNLYRADSDAGPMARLNETLIPTQVPPGSPFGAAYEWLDERWAGAGAQSITTGWRTWICHGHTALHGPVHATAGGEQAVYLPLVVR